MNPSRKRWLIGWAVAVVLLGALLLFADKPWGEMADDAEMRKEIGKQLKVRHYATFSMWWTGLATWIILLVSGLGIRWWTAPVSAVPRGFVRLKKTSRIAWAGLIIIVALGAAFRIPLATKSLAVDELWNAKSTIVGYYLGKPDDLLEERFFGSASFARSLWFYPRPNNHPVASAAARLSHVVLSDLIDRDRLPHEFRDITLRLPTLLASLSCIFILGILGFRFIGPAAGLVAALLLAVQPWHIRFGVEIRGYSWVLLWTLLGVWCLSKIFQTDKVSRWRYWFLFGLIQMLIVWSFLYAAFLATGFFVATVALIFHAWPDWRNRIIALHRLFAVNVMAGLLFINIFAPNFLQMTDWIQTVSENHQNHGLDAYWFAETVYEATIGHRSDSMWLNHIFAAFILLSAGWGAIVLWKNSTQRPLFFVVGGIALGVVFLFITFKITNSFYYPRFASFGLVAVIILTAAGWSAVKKGYVLPILGCLAMLTVAEPQLRILRQKPIEPLRDVSEFLRSQHGTIIPVGYGHSTEYLNVYLPAARNPLTNRAEVEAVIAEARTAERPLYIVIGRPTYNRAAMPDGFELLDDTTLFEERVAFESIEPADSYRVLELLPDSTGSSR